MLFFGLCSTAYGYLDPGTISYVLTLIVAGLAGASYFVKLYWQKLKQFFAKIFKKSEKNKDHLSAKALNSNEKKVSEN